MKNKRGSNARAIFAIIGVLLILVGLFLLNSEEIISAAMIGVIGIILVAISLFPFIKRQ